MDPKWIEIVNQSRKNTKNGNIEKRWKMRNCTNLRNLKLGQGEELEKFGNDIESD